MSLIAAALAPILLGVAAALVVVAICMMLGRAFVRSHEVVVAEAWIPLFFKTSSISVVLIGLALIGVDWLNWYRRDLEVRALIQAGVVIETIRETGRTRYRFDTARSGGLTVLMRYDWKYPPYEALAAGSLIGGSIIGIATVIIARGVVRQRSRRTGFRLTGQSTHV